VVIPDQPATPTVPGLLLPPLTESDGDADRRHDDIDLSASRRRRRREQQARRRTLTILLLGTGFVLLIVGLLVLVWRSGKEVHSDGERSQAARHIDEAGGFSFAPPDGWTARPFPGMKFKVVAGPVASGFAPNIVVTDEPFGGSVDEYVQQSLRVGPRVLKNLRVVSQDPFRTASGLQGMRVAIEHDMNGKRLRQLQYIFDRARTKYVLTCSVLAADGDARDATFDDCMKTFRFDGD
jgi:hypothetical protein